MLIKSLLVFLVSGLCEIGGGYLVWLWVREGRSGGLAIVGTALLTLYGFIATLQPTNFGRAYAAYGGVFVVLSCLWGWKIDGAKVDLYDVLGVLIILMGTAVMMYAPRA
jgi:small multidrug resistance family-3 protein